MGMNQGVQNFLERVFEPCSTNMPKTKEHDELRKASPDMRTIRKIQLMNIVMCQKQTKIILVIHSCAS
jgi:hypothetical protein